METLEDSGTQTAKLVDVISLAAKEKWAEVDALLPVVAQQPEFWGWAEANLKCLDPNIRDLAASIFEKSNLDADNPALFNDEIVKSLFSAVDDVITENPYPSFRAACALAKRQADERIKGDIGKVRARLEYFLEDDDKDVAEQAGGYLSKLAA